ncbi:MAG: DNA polymerase I [Anaeromyxobacteraceae bacterium]
MPTLTLIDGSGFIFRAYHAIPHLSSSKGVPTNAVYGFTTMLLKALREHAPTHVALVFDAGRRSFRNELYPEYKAQRPPPPDDLIPQFPLVRDVARALNVPVLEEVGFEADDIIATLADRARAGGFDVVVVTGDKDFTQLVDDRLALYDPMAEASGRGGWLRAPEVIAKMGVPPGQVVEYQSILGDKVDNVPGIPGVGEKTAAALIQHFGTVEAMLARPDEIPIAVSRGGEKLKEKIVASAERLRLNRKLVELRRDLDYPFVPDAYARRPIDAERARALFKELEFGRLLRDLQAAEGSLTAGAPGLLAAGASTSGAVPGTTPPALPLVAAQPGGAQDAKVELLLEESAVRAAVAAVEGVPAGLVPVLGDGSPQRARIVGLGFAGAGRAFYLPIGHHYLGGPAQLGAGALAKLLAPLVDGPAPRHLHDRKRAIHALGRLGLSLTAPGEDTDLASRLLVPTRREHLLEDVVRERARIDLPPAPIARRGGPGLDGLPVEAIAEWAGAAASALVALAPAVVAELEARGLSKVYREVELPLVPVLAEMEQTGIAVDRGAMEGMSAEFGAAMRELEARIHSAAGHAFNIASTRELARVLFEELALPVQRKLKTGPSTDQEVLEKLAELHPLPGLVLEHRSLSKLKGTYVDALPLLIDAADGRIHTTFNQAGAATGRLSSSDPNLQNIPVRTEISRRIRAAFVAPDGMRLVSADYSQIELRILAHYSKDPALLESFRRGEDVHTRTAAQTFEVAPDQVTPDQRRIAKVLNFGIAYGLSAFGLAARLDLPRDRAQAIIDAYFKRYAGVRLWLDQTIADAKRTGAVRTLWGRERPLPEITSRNQGLRMAAERMAVNTPIQGTAADIVKLAMLRVHAVLPAASARSRLLLQVHDELVVETPEAEVAEVEALLRREMAMAATLDVPLDVEVGHGRSWSEAH